MILDIQFAENSQTFNSTFGEVVEIGTALPTVTEEDYGKLLYVNDSGEQDFLGIGNGFRTENKSLEVDIKTISDEKIIKLISDLQ